MRLYDVPVNSKIKIGENVLDFKHVDGQFSVCYTQEGYLVHPSCHTECEVIEEEE